MKVWLNVCPFFNRFVKSILTFYYKTDDDVQHDTELQNWIIEIFENGFNSEESTGNDSVYHHKAA